MTGWIHRTTLAVMAAALLLPASVPLPAGAGEAVIRINSAEQKARTITLGRGKSVVVELPRDARDVLVANPAVANAVVRSARRAFLIGIDYGQTNVVFFDDEGRQIAAFDILIGADVSALTNTLRRLIPNGDIHVDLAGSSIVLSGTVANAADAAQAVKIASAFVGESLGSANSATSVDAQGANAADSKGATTFNSITTLSSGSKGSDSSDSNGRIINRLAIKAKEQIMLKVVVAEVQRAVAKQFGVDLKGQIDAGTIVDFATVNVPGVAGKWLAEGTYINTQTTFNSGKSNVDFKLRALEQAGVIRTLAEPTLTAISGESAKFTAGGEFPIIAGYTLISGYQIDWKKFGVMLDFTPVVLSEGRISLRMSTEVSELDYDNGVKMESLTIPGIKVRRASSTLELPSGGSLVLAGLIKEETKSVMTGLPGLQSVPVLGALFRSRDFQNGETELMIIVTPYVVNPVARQQLQTPEDGFVPASDPAAVLLGRINRVYGLAGRIDPARPYHGTYGFIID
ncbi:type II and III secretion system protein family protein [Blastochloris sulfoviridis]|uniref:Type II and III secretion system protein family protein n=1 Tax=Blastochloris sulfoviridis TaxID=50712 RepID=A0A5M6I6J2_9HYPH|nr:type II and III secretion system protein family protein [Blastochloris sulfoviridis]KAA5603418.1 type II and III secretion system protein family protein [Blastochloris sulfoviridis]